MWVRHSPDGHTNRQADRQVGGQYLGAVSQSLSHVVVNSHSQSHSKGFIRGDAQQDKSFPSMVKVNHGCSLVTMAAEGWILSKLSRK